MSESLRCALVSLGCPKNLVDSEVMLGFLNEAGFQVTTDRSEAEVLIVNTCAFLSASIDESVDALRDVVSYKGRDNCKAVIATGCLPQRDLPFLRKAVPGIDGFVGAADLPSIVPVVRDAVAGRVPVAVTQSGYVYEDTTPRMLATPGWTAYIKIAEGCNHKCTFCVIPQIRGPFRSRPVESIVSEARRLGDKGVKEIVLISQDSTRYGLDIYGKRNIEELLSALAAVESVEWIRLLYCYPTFVSDQLIKVMASHDRLCKYFDIPLQHAHPTILEAMKRPGSAADYRRLVEKIRRTMPDVTLRTTFIVGFPGETEEHFRFLLDFVEEMQFDRMAGFRYSPEPGAPSATYPDQVPVEVAEERYHRLMVTQQKVSQKVTRRKIGCRIKVLLEQTSGHKGTNGNGGGSARFWKGVGRSEGDAPDIDATVYVNRCESRPGDMINVRITGAHEYDIEGKQTA